MGLSKYYKPWEMWELAEVPSEFPPPWDNPTFELQATRKLQGLFKQDQSAETMIAAAQGIDTRGRFACKPSENLKHGDVLRSEELGVFIRLEGDPLTAPSFASTQVQTWAAVVTSRTVEEQTALKFAGTGG
jgi:hypothetical protein